MAQGDLAAAAAAGFDHVLWQGAALPPGLADAGLAVLGDLDISRADLRTGGEPGPFMAVLSPTLDPRHPPGPATHAVAALTDAESAAALGRWWGARINEQVSEGLAGVRLLGLHNLPAPLVPGFLASLRAACPNALLFGWTPGLPWEVLAALPHGTLDLVASSLPWWDGSSDWLWREFELLRPIAPVVADAGEHASPGRTRLAAVMAEGWMTHDMNSAGLNAQRASAVLGYSRLVTPPGGAVAGILLTDTPDPRRAQRAVLAVVNLGSTPALQPAAALLTAAGVVSGPFTLADGQAIGPETSLPLEPGALLLAHANAALVRAAEPLAVAHAAQAALAPRLAIEAPCPCVDGGRFPARRTLGNLVPIEADIIGDGHDKLAAMLRWRAPGETAWSETPMRPLGNDRWAAAMPLNALGVHHYTIEAWRDAFSSFTDELGKKFHAGVPITLELLEGEALVQAAAGRAPRKLQAALKAVLRLKRDQDAWRDALLSPGTAALMQQADDRPHSVTLDRPIPLQAERLAAGFASWYEMFPRSMSDDASRHGTFRDVIRHLPRIRRMGFDVLYFPPIHPIGRKNRKGRNNTLTPAPDDPGSPYAIGSEDGGHDALHPELGSIEDFQHLRAAAAQHGIELALDFAIQCSPDHPWLQQHKDWFTWRPDGSIRYAENPPKKYEDIVNVDFYAPGAVPGLWVALCEAVLYWAAQGVRLFRVDNPHTKPLPFWEWMIAEVQARYPDTVFLSEAFTRPKVMYRLAKAGFSQSYTYFTWRNTKREFQEYLTELTQGPAREFMRPHFFVNTPDINPVPLHTSGRPGFLIRAALACTLSGLWGLYNGFELCEGTPVAPGKEEYLDSEKYEIRAWDWDRPGNITAEIAQLNAIRKLNPALQTHLGLTFLDAPNDQVLWFEKATADRSNVVLVAISLDYFNTQSSTVSIPFWRYDPHPGALDAADLLRGTRERWHEWSRTVTLTPDQPYALWRITPTA